MNAACALFGRGSIEWLDQFNRPPQSHLLLLQGRKGELENIKATIKMKRQDNTLASKSFGKHIRTFSKKGVLVILPHNAEVNSGTTAKG